MTAKHTPGPWRLSQQPYQQNTPQERIVATVESISGAVAHVLAHSGSTDRAVEARANAQLIATAPELLKELDGLIEMAVCAVRNYQSGHPDPAMSNLARLAAEAKSVAAKAR